jgi:nucleoid-associated protein EbfC
MNINPFELLKNAQALQERMAEMQKKLDTITVSGQSGGGMAKVTLNGKMEMVALEIAPECIESADPKADLPLIADLVRAAYTDAQAKLKELLQAEYSGLTGGMGLPPGLGL